jgi:hypothetical protein
VIHGCIDGDTRTVIYLEALDNNLSTSTIVLFKDAVKRYQLPARVRGDKGGENVLIAEWMIKYSLYGNAFLVGRSTHNTRIERLWLDVRKNVVDFYRNFFKSLEDFGLNINMLIDVYVLQYLFLPKINFELKEFIQAWNHHGLSTENNITPIQLMRIREDFMPPPVDIEEAEYGVDDDIGDEGDEVDFVEVYPLESPFSDIQQELFIQHCNRFGVEEKDEHVLTQYYFEARDLAIQIFNEIDE